MSRPFSDKGDHLPELVAELLRLLDPVIVGAADQAVIYYLVNTVAGSPWLNHLALAAAVHVDTGVVHPTTTISNAHRFLAWAIPEHYEQLDTLKPEEGLTRYLIASKLRGYAAVTGYQALQHQLQRYLHALDPEQREQLGPYLLPRLVVTRKLDRLVNEAYYEARFRRKRQAYVVSRELRDLVILGWQRYQWLLELDAQVQRIAKRVQSGEVTLPVVIQHRALDGGQVIEFHIWNRPSWMQAHRWQYDQETLKRKLKGIDDRLFLQLVGPIPDAAWFLRAVERRVLYCGTDDEPQVQDYLQAQNIGYQVFSRGRDLCTPGQRFGMVLSKAQTTAAGTPEDSQVLFCLEPLLPATALGLFVLVCVTQTGMRIGELQQLTGDKESLRLYKVRQVEDGAGHLIGVPMAKQFYWALFPKGSTKRTLYAVTIPMQEALRIWGEVHQRFCSDFQAIRPNRVGFHHHRRFPGTHPFVLQWKGHQLHAPTLSMCLQFLLLEHGHRDEQGMPIRITPHLLRHGVAGYLRNHGVPLEEIARLLKHANTAVTEYYSQPSPEELYARLGPVLTQLCEVADLDPRAVRTADDLQKLAQEAVKRYGWLRQIPGGHCASFESCEVHFKCAQCTHYLPDPARRHEVEGKIHACGQAIHLFETQGDVLEAKAQRTHQHQWQRVLAEMDGLAEAGLRPSPLEEMLRICGFPDLAAEEPEWLVSLESTFKLLPG